MSTTQESQAVANALAADKTFKQVSFPLTGDPMLDAISGCLAAIDAAGITHAQSAHLCRYLAERFTQEKADAEARSYWGQIGAVGTGTIPAPPNPLPAGYKWTMDPLGPQGPPPAAPWTTGGGGLPYPPQPADYGPSVIQ